MIQRLKSKIRRVFGRQKSPWNITADYRAATQSLAIRDSWGYESRNFSTIHLLLMALAEAKKEIKQDFVANIITEDFVQADFTKPHFAYCADSDAKSTILIPDHLFWGWPEVGIPDYEKTVDEIISASKSTPQDARLFWIGNVAMHQTRSTLMELAQNDKRICAVGMNWVPAGNNLPTGRLQTKNNVFVSLPDHCKYKYLIDLQGRGYSGRLKLLLFSGRLLFIQNRKWREYFFDDLKPFEHFIPVKEDLGDLASMLDWAESHSSEAQMIADRAFKYATTHLRRHHAVGKFRECLTQLASM